MAADGDDEDDYLSMSFDQAATSGKETSLQRTARLKKEASERGRVPSKKELAEKARIARETALATELDASNKGAKMMAKMGFKGGALGKTENARTQPIELTLKEDRGGIGMDSEKKRKFHEAAAELEGAAKHRKMDPEEFRDRTRLEVEEKRNEGLMWGAMKTLEGFETGAVQGDDAEQTDASDEKKQQDPARQPVRSMYVLWRPLVKQRLEKERERRARYDLDQSLSRRGDHDDLDVNDDKAAFGTEIEDLDDEEDTELDEFEALSFVDRLTKIVTELRQKYRYCFWCKYRYPDEAMDGCPGLTEDEHG